MHMNKVVLTLAMLLSGCTTTFTHTTQAPAEFDRELYGCQVDAAPIQDRARSTEMVERCMMIKGWRKAGYAWGFDRFAPVTAQSSAASAIGRGVTGATSSSSREIGISGTQTNESAPTSGTAPATPRPR